jgi:hypothetical protein
MTCVKKYTTPSRPDAASIPLVALQQLAHDVQRGLLVSVQLRILVAE